MPKKERVGRVVSDKMDKSIVVEVADHNPHPTYKKIITSTKNYLAHDPKAECGIGDTVRIIETKPISKNKKWMVAEVIEQAT